MQVLHDLTKLSLPLLKATRWGVGGDGIKNRSRPLSGVDG